MRESLMSKLKNSWRKFVCAKSDNQAMETLTSYIKDSEHEELTIITALKAHLDLMRDEQARNSQSLGRFDILNRSIQRLIADIESLAIVSQQAVSTQIREKLLLEDLFKEIEVSTQTEFKDKGVTLSWNIKKGTSLLGNAIQLKHMLTEILFTILHQSKRLDNISVTGQIQKKCVSLIFSADPLPKEMEFLPWRLGELRLIPANGEGIGLATIAAMARLQQGQLSMTGLRTEKQVYKLIFNT